MNLNIFRKPTSEKDVIDLLKTRRLLFWVVVAFIALLIMLGDSLPISGIAAFLLMLICVPVCIYLGFLAFNNNADSALKEFRLSHCTCGEAVVYHENVTYYTTGSKIKDTTRDTKNGDIDTIIMEYFMIEYQCPKCHAIRKYEASYTTERIKQNIAGVVLSHTKHSLEEKNVKEVFDRGFRLSTLLNENDE